MSFTYAIGDIHGRLDLLVQALEKIQEIEAGLNLPYTVVFCGDYVDRGLQSAQVVDLLMAGPTDDNATWVCLKGNHEDMMLQSLAEKSLGWWIGNGGAATLLSYDPTVKTSKDVYPLSGHLIRHCRWMEKLPLYHVDQHRAFVHAGFNPLKPLDQQIDEHMMWDRNLAYDDYAMDDKFVVHGHTIVENGPVQYKNKINLDVGAVFSGRMPIAVFDDDQPGPPVSILEVTGPTLQVLLDSKAAGY